MILPVGYFLRAVINARLLLYFLLELSVFVLFHALFYRRLGKWYTRGVIQVSVGVTIPRGVLEKDPAPHLTARQEQAVQVLSSNKAPFRRYPECFLALVGLSPYYPFGENTYPAFEGPDRTDMGLLDYIRTADPRKVQAVEVQKGEEQVTLFDSIKHCFVSLDPPAAAHQASGSGSGAGAEVSAPPVEGNVVEENVIPGDAQKQPEKAKRKKLLKRSDPLPAKRLRVDHPSLASETGGKTLAYSRVADAPVYTTVDTVTSSRGKTLVLTRRDVGGLPTGRRDKSRLPEIARVGRLLRVTVYRRTIVLPFLFPVCSRHLKSSLDDSQAACDEAKNLISSLSSKRDGLVSEVFSSLRSAFRDFKDKMEAQQEAQAQELYNRVADLEAHTEYGINSRVELAMIKCLKSPKYQRIMGHALGRAVDYGMQEGLAAGHEHGVAGTSLSRHGVTTCRLLRATICRYPCLEQLSVPIYHSDVNAVVGETSLSFALLNVHNRAEDARKHAAALRWLMVDIVSHPLSSQNLLGEASTSAVAFCVDDLDTDEDWGTPSQAIFKLRYGPSILGPSLHRTWHGLDSLLQVQVDSQSFVVFSLIHLRGPKCWHAYLRRDDSFCAVLFALSYVHLLAGVFTERNALAECTVSHTILKMVCHELAFPLLIDLRMVGQIWQTMVPLIMAYLIAFRRTAPAFFVSPDRISFVRIVKMREACDGDLAQGIRFLVFTSWYLFDGKFLEAFLAQLFLLCFKVMNLPGLFGVVKAVT
ncbi:hypothetical protein Tco_0529555 [Tanacetum coccineum]